MLRLRLVRAARQDVLENIAWYREQAGRERAQDFRAELTRVMEFARRFPRGGPVVADSIEDERLFRAKPIT